MWKKIRVVFTIPELRQKILLTLFMLAIYRVGFQIPLPILDSTKIQARMESGEESPLSQIFEHVAMLSATNLSQATIFGLGIMPYISASIIFQLLGSVYPPLERLKKEGPAGQKKINEYTRYATVFLCIIQSYAYIKTIDLATIGNDSLLVGTGDARYLPWHWTFTSVMTMTCGTVFLMWLGEQIDEYGIGNGISLLIMAGILARMPGASLELFAPIASEGLQLDAVNKIIVAAVLFVAVVVGVVYITLGQRRIPTQSAKHIRGRRVFGGGGTQYLPLRVNQAGVMPIIFASSLLLFPRILFTTVKQPLLEEIFTRGTSFIYNLMYIGLIYFFCYFWTAITFNPKEMASNLKDHGSFIPGYRPGKRTADYLEKVMVRITYVGAGFLALVAILPTIVASWTDINYTIASFYGGTALLIAVSVAFDLVQKIDNHLLMRNYKGLLDKN